MNRRGFTLIELIISIAILSIIMAGVYPVFTTIYKFNIENYIRTMVIDNLNAVVDIMNRDIAQALGYDEDGKSVGIKCDRNNFTKKYYIENFEDDDTHSNIVIVLRNPKFDSSCTDPNDDRYYKYKAYSYELRTSGYSIGYFSEGKEIIKNVEKLHDESDLNEFLSNDFTNSPPDGEWDSYSNPISEPVFYSMNFKKQKQLIRISLSVKCKFDPKGDFQTFTYIYTVGVRNPLPVSSP